MTQAAILALALVLAILGVEAAVHSVHHLGHPDEAPLCPVVSAPHDLSLTDDPPVLLSVWMVSQAPLEALAPVRPGPSFSPFEGRAPPAPPSA